MPAIRLLDIDSQLAATLKRRSDFEAICNVLLGENVETIVDVVEQIEALGQATGAKPPWVGYLAVGLPTNEVVGTCAFKGGPDQHRAVEIAYFTFPPFESRGFGTAMARTLEERASDSGCVSLIVAHTLPEENASTRVLRKLGYCHAGEVRDPEDGMVWRWERSLPEGPAA